jgi:hypothetical protein
MGRRAGLATASRTISSDPFWLDGQAWVSGNRELDDQQRSILAGWAESGGSSPAQG